MFSRIVFRELEKWAASEKRKPLVLRGARQVGKTTLVNLFGTQFDQYLYLNLEIKVDSDPFREFTKIEDLVQSLFFAKNKKYSAKQKTLIFIDEIQEVPEALNILRYFYEQMPELYIIAAGSMLESLFDRNISFPVGRVDYLVVRPVSFPEFLDAIGEKTALKELTTIPIASFAHEKLLQLFKTYSLIGGMPEIVEQYAKSKDLVSLNKIYESLIVSYIDDVEKYASNNVQLQTIRQAIRASYSEAGKRIKFQGFGKSNYGSREMGEALRALEKALLIQLIYPQTNVVLPLMPDYKKSPRLQVLDTGMLNYFVGIQKEIMGTQDLNNVYNGIMIEHLVGQELLASHFNALYSLNFWVREKKTSMAEIDYIYPFEGNLIPVEVKSGAAGTLKSLHLYMDESPHKMAIRFYSGDFKITGIKTMTGKDYHLLNLPYYLASQLDGYIAWFEEEVKKMEGNRKRKK
ncbi:MAG: AAA family ATPase [Bacteroidota bacterium]|nr:AAA family ATPase [Bacteroidota bacterium]